MAVRPAILAGQFYPANPGALEDSIQSFLTNPQLPPEFSQEVCLDDATRTWSCVRPMLTMLPHAGHVYCGNVAGATLKNIQLPSRLIILAPSHTGAGHPLGFWPEGSWETPLGSVPIDKELGQELAGINGVFAPDTTPHRQEHAIEVLLPFLQRVRPDIRILPVVVRQVRNMPDAAHALAKVMGVHSKGAAHERVGLIVSSDMNHFENDVETRRRDALALKALLALDAHGLFEVVRQNSISMCGIMPALIALLACQELGAAHARLMAYDTSASAFGSTQRVVGYAGIRFW